MKGVFGLLAIVFLVVAGVAYNVAFVFLSVFCFGVFAVMNEIEKTNASLKELLNRIK